MEKINFQKKENFISNYYDLLNKILSDYYKYLFDSLNLADKKSKDYIFYIVELFDLKKEIEKINFDLKLDCSGYYYFDGKELMINFNEMIRFYKLDIIDKSTLLIEYFTTLFHELIHAIQYRILINNDESVMLQMKRISIELKRMLFDNITLHHLFPDEREANIESSKIIYNFFKNYYIENFRNSEDNLIFHLGNGYLKTINGIYKNPISIIYNEETKEIIKKHCDIKVLSDYEKLLYGFELNGNLQNILETSKQTKTINSELVKMLKL